MSSPQYRPLHIEQLGEIYLVTITTPEVLSLSLIDLIGKQLRSLVDDGGCRRLVLNFRNVKKMSTPLLGKVIGLHNRLRDAGGRLALCGIAPDLFEIFDLLRLPRLLSVHADEQGALLDLQSCPTR